MNLTLTRNSYTPFGIFGALTDEANNQVCVTLEHSFDNLPKVAAGTYTCRRHPPNRLPYETWMLENVPDFQGKPVTYILIHVGNYNKDTDGCILVGRNILPNPDAPSENMITSSENTFNRIKDLTVGLTSFTLTIKDTE